MGPESLGEYNEVVKRTVEDVRNTVSSNPSTARAIPVGTHLQLDHQKNLGLSTVDALNDDDRLAGTFGLLESTDIYGRPIYIISYTPSAL